MGLLSFVFESSSLDHFNSDAFSNLTLNEKLVDTWNYVFYELSDKRTSQWPLMDNVGPTLAILIVYLSFVGKWGPKAMEMRKPIEFQNLLVFYNFLQVLLSTWIVSRSWLLWTKKYSVFGCESIDREPTRENMEICWGFYVYYLAKLSELLDTVFFVLRKKQNQITFLHLYHHSGMVFMSWCTTKYLPGGHAAFIGFINSIVHIVMYFYYMLAAMGPKIQQYLWWKRWITILQLAQFALAFVHFTQVLYNDCNYPKWTVIIVFPNAFFFYYLFWDFYQKAYTIPHLKKEEDADFTYANNNSEAVSSGGTVVKRNLARGKSIG